MPSSSNSYQLRGYGVIPFIGPPLTVIFYPHLPYQPATTWLLQTHPPVVVANLYPPPGLPHPQGLNPGQLQAQINSQAASSSDQPANQFSHQEVITIAQSTFLPFLTREEIVRIGQIDQIFINHVIPPRLVSAYYYQDILSISINPSGTRFLNTLISKDQLAAEQYRFLDGDHINQLNEQNTLKFFQVIRQSYDVFGPQAPHTPIDQIQSFDMLHLFFLGPNIYRSLERNSKLTGLQRDFIKTVKLHNLVAETANLNFLNTYIGNPRRSIGLDKVLIEQLFILAAAKGNDEFLPGLGAISYLDDATLSRSLPSGVYGVTQLFSQFGAHNELQAPVAQVATAQSANAANLCGGIQGNTLSHISTDAFNNLVDYVNTHNTHIYFNYTNLIGLEQERFFQITNETLMQSFIHQQFTGEEWRNYFQSHPEINNWSGLVTWLNEYNTIHHQYSTDQLNHFFANIAEFVRHRLTILQDIYNNMTDEQKVTFGDALGYHGEGGRRMQQIGADGDEVLGDVATKASMHAGETINGKLESNADHDWYKVDLKAGVTYKFLLRHFNNADQLDPWLNLRNTSGKIIKSDDDSGGNNDAFIQYKAAKTGSYFLDVCSWQEKSHGQFSLAVMPA